MDQAQISLTLENLQSLKESVAFIKKSFAPVAPPGGPPMDPAMAQGGMPQDPAMMQGGPPMDPAMAQGGMPMDPAMMDPAMGGAPPGGGIEEIIPIIEEMGGALEQLDQGMQEMAQALEEMGGAFEPIEQRLQTMESDLTDLARTVRTIASDEEANANMEV